MEIMQSPVSAVIHDCIQKAFMPLKNKYYNQKKPTRKTNDSFKAQGGHAT